MRYLITGANSCTGQHLWHLLENTKGVEVFGSVRPETVEAGSIPGMKACDWRHQEQIEALIAEVRPHRIIHLVASTDESDPNTLTAINVSGTLHLLQACHRHQSGGEGILIVGSAGGFGEMAPEEKRLSPDRPAHPGSLYGWSRESQRELSRVAGSKWELPVYQCRPFNLVGPGLKPAYAPARLLDRLLESEKDRSPTLAIRDLDAVRDFVDARDVARAYLAIIERGEKTTPYSIGRGVAVSIRQLVEIMVAERKSSIRILEDKAATGQRTGILRSVADISRLRADAGWSPRYTLPQSVADMIAERTGDSHPVLQS